MKRQRSRIADTILKNKVGELIQPDFKAYYKATGIKSRGTSKKNRQTDQWNRRESPEIGPHKYSQLIFDKRAKAIQ